MCAHVVSGRVHMPLTNTPQIHTIHRAIHTLPKYDCAKMQLASPHTGKQCRVSGYITTREDCQ